MATITKYSTTSGKARYRADIRIKKKGKIIHRESKSFDRKRLAEDWAKAREVELQSQGGLDKARFGSVSVGDVVQRYIDHFEPEEGWGRSKKFDLNKLLGYPIADASAVDLTTQDLVAHAHHRKGMGAGPATIGNDLIWLNMAFKSIRASDGIPIDLAVIEDARVVLRKNRLIAKAGARDRRPTRAELWKLSRYFWRKQHLDERMSIPMLDIMWFQIYSARRDAETCRLEWADNNPDRLTGMVRDAKHPRTKKGNHKRFKYTRGAWKIVQRQPKEGDLIFPYNPRSVSTAFTRACKVLGIHDLRLHDLRHEATSRLFEQGYSIEQVALHTLHDDWKTLKRYTHLRPEDLD